jgi:GNAT superfamily N-acetyltransferase
VTEGAIQPFVYNYKQEINSPYELTDALFNMAAGGIGQGLLSGAGHAIGKGFSKLIGKHELPDTHETRALRRDIQKLLELQHFADETGAKTVGELEIHLNALNKAMADIQAGRKVDYDSLGKTIEREYLELFDTEINGTRSTMDHIANLRHKLDQIFDADLHSKQQQLEQFGEQKLSPLELNRAKAKADTQTEGELNQETDLDAIREIQKNAWEKTVGEDTVRLNDEANKANNELRASRRDEGDMIAMKKEMDALDQQYSDAVEYHRAAKKARDVYVADQAEQTSQAIKIAPTDTPRMRAVKDAVNRIVLSLGGQDIKVRVYEGNPDVDGDMRFSMDDGEGSAGWAAAEAKGLDMSQEGRMARAKAMGFDVDTPVYHSTAKDFDAFDPDRAIGTQFWTTTDRASIEAGEVGAQGSGVIKTLYHRIKNPAGWDEYDKLGIDELIARGYDGLKLSDPDGSFTFVAFDPSQYRSVNAAFDPDFIDSPNLRYSLSSKETITADNAQLTSLVDEIELSGIELDVYIRNGGEIYLSKIALPKDGRGEGAGTAAMSKLIDFANRTGRTIALTPDLTYGATSIKRLKKFYTRLGFVNNTGKNKDFSFMESMYRKPDSNLRYSLSKQEVAAMRALATKQRHGEDVDTDYRMTHTSPIREGANSIDDLSDIYPDDVYNESLALRYYGTGDKAMDAESVRIIASLKDNPDAYVIIYRSVPEGVDDINAGDWVSINREYAESHGASWVDNGKYTIIEEEVRARDIVTNGDSIHEWGYDPNGRLGERFSKSGDTIEAAINPETGELHINASAFRDEAHLMEVIREEVIGHYGLRKVLGDNFQSVIDDIKATAMTNPELRQMWIDLSGVDPQTKQVINPNAPYKGMADDVIADEIISKMARNEISDTTWLKLKNIIIKALRKIGLVKDDITISEMKALVVKSEKALKKNAVKPAKITGLTPQAKPNDEALHNEAVEAEAARVINDETVEGVVFDEHGNTVNFRDALIEDENEIAAIESVKVCML